jgi:hypothetical protein
MKQRTFYIIITATIIIIFTFAFMMALLIKENSRCVAEPLVYGARHIETNDLLLCSCQVGLQSFYFDKDGMYKENPLLSNIQMKGG